MIFSYFWVNLLDTVSRKIHAYAQAHTHIPICVWFQGTCKSPEAHAWICGPREGPLWQVLTCDFWISKCDQVHLLIIFSPSCSLLSSGQSPNSLIWLSVPFTSPVSHLVIPVPCLLLILCPVPSCVTISAATLSGWQILHPPCSSSPLQMPAFRLKRWSHHLSIPFSTVRPSQLWSHSLIPVYMLHSCTCITFCIYPYWSLDVPALELSGCKLL